MDAFGSELLTSRRNWASRLVEVLQPVSVRADHLGTMEVFATLGRNDLEFVAGVLRETLIVRGTRMSMQGQPLSHLWLVIEGEALVSADARPIRVVGEGDFSGLESMLDSNNSPATTIALSSIRAFEADRKALGRLMAKPSLRKRLIAAEATLSGWSGRPIAARRRS